MRLICGVRGKRLMIGVDHDTEAKQPRAEETVRDVCRKKGVLISRGGTRGGVIQLQPPLTLSQEEIHHAFSVLAESLTENEIVRV